MSDKTYEITITVDTNDADFATEVSEISSEDLELIKPLIAAIRALKGNHHNYPYGEQHREDMGEKGPQELYNFNEEVFEIFEDYFPDTEYGFHTIKSVSVCLLVEKERLL